MTLKQLYLESDRKLFNGFSLTGIMELEEDLNYFFMLFGHNMEGTLIPCILRRAGHFACIYDTVEECAEAVMHWSAENVRRWNGLIATTVQKYELTHNYDRTETVTDKRTVLENVENTATHSGEDNSTRNAEGSSAVENKVSAFDSSDYQSKDKSESSGQSSETGKNTSSGNMSNTGKRDNTETVERTIRAFGNIGVTTAQQMLEEERKLLKFNISEYIANEFVENFCIMVY